MLLGPKDGRQLLGPINADIREIHYCYTDFILAGLAKQQYLLDTRDSLERRLHLWNSAYPHGCRTTCPGAPETITAQPDAAEEVSNPGNATSQERLQVRRSSRISSSATSTPTTLSPLVLLLDVNDGSPSNLPAFIQPPSPTLAHVSRNTNVAVAAQPLGMSSNAAPSTPIANIGSGHFVIPAVPDAAPASQYVSPSAVTFETMKVFGAHILANRGTSPEALDGTFCFQVSGETVADAAQNLVSAINSTNRSHTTAMDLPEGVSVEGVFTLTLSKLFQLPRWCFRAYVFFLTAFIRTITNLIFSGSIDMGDVVGDGVMREILMAAIRSLLHYDHGLVEESANEDGYVGLKIAVDYVSGATLDKAFMLGVLCAIFMIKTQAGPDPISPALIQAAIGGVDSLIDYEWIRATNDQVAEKLALLPTDHQTPIPDTLELRRLFESTLPGIRVCIIWFFTLKTLTTDMALLVFKCSCVRNG